MTPYTSTATATNLYTSTGTNYYSDNWTYCTDYVLTPDYIFRPSAPLAVPKSALPPAAPESPLAWLDRRVNEVRVSL
jgi:hypothetical protein